MSTRERKMSVNGKAAGEPHNEILQGVDYLGVAADIGLDLCRDAIWYDGRCNWMGASVEPLEGQWKTVQRTFGTDFYGGTSGIGWFLSALSEHVEEPELRRTAIGAIGHALASARATPQGAALGFYTGSMGVAFAAIQCGRTLDREDLIEEAWAMITESISVDIEAEPTDVLSGVAGAIVPLIKFGVQDDREDLLALAIRLGDHLLDIARQDDRGVSWDTIGGNADEGEHNILGFSHGTAGIAWALLELGSVTGDARFEETARAAFEYEQSWFDEEQKNWPDLRSYHRSLQMQHGGRQGEPGFMSAWCHGAPGVALSRIRAWELTGDPSFREQAEVAVATTREHVQQTVDGGQGNFSLCHGMGGNADVLIFAAKRLGDDDSLVTARNVAAAGVRDVIESGASWPCGLMNAEETPGLFLGTAGIGYFYLRLHDPEVKPVTIVLPEENAEQIRIAQGAEAIVSA